MMVSEAFFTELWNQLLTDQADSFLARYLRKEKEEAFSHATLDELLGFLADRNKKLQLEARLEAEYQEWLDHLRERVPGLLPADGAAEHTRGGRVQYRLLREALKNHPEAVLESEVRRLRGIVQDAAAVQSAWTFLYNSGFCRSRKWVEDETTGQKTVKITLDRISPEDKTRKLRKEDRTFRMLDEWCRATNHYLAWAGASREDWKEMFRLLQGETGKERNDLILPVKIDPNTGIGLYLVGLHQFTEKFIQQLRNRSGCGPALNYVFLCLGPSVFIDQTQTRANIKKEFKSQFAEGISISLNPMMDENHNPYPYCVTLKDGEELFSFLQKNERISYDFFCYNNESPPPGTPKALHIYFETEKMDLHALADEGRKASEEDAERQKNAVGRVRPYRNIPIL